MVIHITILNFAKDMNKTCKEVFGNKYATELNRCYKSNNLKTKVPNKIVEATKIA